MKKSFQKIISLCLAAVLVISLGTLFVSAKEFDKTTIRTTNDPNNSITVTIDGNKLFVEGVVNYVDGLDAVCIIYQNDGEKVAYAKTIPAENNSYFSSTVTLEKVKGAANIGIDIKRNGEDKYIPYYSGIGRIVKKGSHYEFVEPEKYQSNLDFSEHWRNIERYDAPEEGEIFDFLLDLNIKSIFDIDWVVGYLSMFLDLDLLDEFIEKRSDELFKGHPSDETIEIMVEWASEITETRHIVKALSDEIVGDETDDYKKLRLLNEWVAENLYYDMRFETEPDAILRAIPDVLEQRYTICLGYADLLACMIKEQGIPATCVTCSNPLDDPDNVNHIYVEAFLDGRWIYMDPTWDSANSYDGVIKTDASPTLSHFDMTDEVLAVTHAKSTCMEGFASAFDTPSAWAKDEITAAFAAGFVPDALQSQYRTSITRKEFCDLLMNMIYDYVDSDGLDDFAMKYLGSEEAILGIEGFEDDNTTSVLLAKELGIVNGVGEKRFNPDGSITREQAATMLKRAAEFLGVSAGEGIAFADSDMIADWAKDGVDFVSGLVSTDGSAVMGGTGEDKFSPKNSYTREQSILTIYRLFRCK